ncbi:AraC family transcriptional regulator [Paenibacillus macquariensis]|uniref:AraC-like ligand binding domain-containing protein n=2 Tax=Paenibacillus macquariensis TaxID=948756 RepID=A0ABY1KCY1_9BACL|nr:AraC family transcriptional regulator [Paenibacillus macquariensis]SIR62564.1 AraC-like ligand binding domain-containing protein [Paenibacillus macquariensis]
MVMNHIKKTDGFMSQKLIVLPEHIIAEYATHPLIRSLYITDIGFFPHALHHYRERPTGSVAHIVMYCIEGEGWVSLNGQKKQNMRKGSIMVIPANMPHEYASSETHPWTIYWFHMKGENAVSFFEGIDQHATPTLVSVEKSAKIIELFHECYDLLQKGYSLNRIIYVSQLACHLAALIRFSQQQPNVAWNQQKKHDIEFSLQFMMEHLEKNVSLQELADQANLSVPHYTHVFKKTTGYSPIDYYLRLKIQLACQHLDLTEQSIKEISIRLGFQDPYYFSRLFKKIMGKSPSEYRNTRKG